MSPDKHVKKKEDPAKSGPSNPIFHLQSSINDKADPFPLKHGAGKSWFNDPMLLALNAKPPGGQSK